MTDDDDGKPDKPDDPDGGQVVETPWELEGDDDCGKHDLNGDQRTDSDGGLDGEPGDEHAPEAVPGKYRPPAFGEIVSKRHPVLIALVMLLALFLAVAPFLFRYERNVMHDAVVVYTDICKARESGRLTDDWLKSVSGPGLLSRTSDGRLAFVAGMECLAPEKHSFALRLVEGRALGPNRAYVLSVFKGADVKDVEKAGGHVANFFFPVIGDRLVIDEMPAGSDD